ncbi:M23 family metallopeptidase [Advenella sp. FME57]|uniref:M23 family metallopeptidase n=1 Tax=Advenella sp. FME57 TaxID=2742604 RepID=UPI0018687ADF|nr:M23 family metallopeptidase [Advenella sp. FME57]
MQFHVYAHPLPFMRAALSRARRHTLVLLGCLAATMHALPSLAQSDEDLDTMPEVPTVDGDVKTIRGLADDLDPPKGCSSKGCGPSLKLDLKIMGFLSSPLDKSYVSSRFGLRMHPIYNQLRFHAGVDLVAPVGSQVKTTLGGKVSFVGAKGGYGNTVIVEHGSGYATLYAHLQKFAPRLAAGRVVDKGEVIGHLGDTGKVTGAHLHYEIRYNNYAVNPLTGQGAAGIGRIQKTSVIKGGQTQRMRSGRIRTIIRH